MDLKDLKIFEAKLLSIEFKRFICRLNLDEMRIQVKRALCKHDYNAIAMHKWARANLWKCEKCGDIGMQNYTHNYWLPHWNDKVNIDDWRPFPSSRDLKGELDE